MRKLWIQDDIWEEKILTIDVVEEKTDEPIGNFIGLFDHKGRPLFRPKERIGFKIGIKQSR